MDIEGAHNQFSSYQDAILYLRSHPFGTVEHRDMDDASFIFLDFDGTLHFYDGPKDEVEILDFEEELNDIDIWQPPFFYVPGSEMALTVMGIAGFDEMRRSPLQAARQLPVVNAP